MKKAAVGVAVACAAVACSVAAYVVATRVKNRNKWNRRLAILRDFQNGCATPLHRLRQMVDAMAVEMHAGLASEGGSKLKMLLTFVDNLPTGFDKDTHPELVRCANPSKKLMDLGFTFKPADVAIRDAVLSLQKKGFLKH